MNNIKLLLKNRKFVTLTIIAYFMLCFIDTKSFGITYSQEDMVFRLLSHQIFLIFITPILILSVLNEKFLRIQKNYMVLYIKEEKISISKIVITVLIISVMLYILGQIIFQGIHYLLLHNTYIQSLQLNLLTILEMLSATYISVFILLILKNDLFTYTIFYIFVILLLVVNNPYITMPMTIKALFILGYEFYKLLVSRIVWLIVSFTAFRISLNRYSRNFYEE